MSPGVAGSSALRTTLGIAAALVIAVLGFLPIANWIPGGHEAPWYGAMLGHWGSGAVIVSGIAILLTIISQRVNALWHDGILLSHEKRLASWPVTLLITALALASYVLVARLLLGATPLFIDEIVQLLQARIYAGGALWLPADSHPEFFSIVNVVDAKGRVYGQFPAGGPAMLAAGDLLGASWMIVPVFGAISILAFSAIVRRAEHRPLVTAGAVALFAFAPFTLFMSGSYMNHVTALAWILIGAAGLARLVNDARPPWWGGVVCGIGFGMAATIRPVDALAFALPAGAWLVHRAMRDRSRWMQTLAAGAGVALPVLLLMWVNNATTGSPLLFGYQVLWGASHDLGFHQTPWGFAHTPVRGLELINLYFLRLQSHLFEAPVPSLLAPLAALLLTRRLSALDRYLIASGALLIALYFAYWHDGFYLGPRFVYPLAPIMALWTARLPALIRERWGAGSAAHRTTIYALVVSTLMAVAMTAPTRAREYAGSMATMRWDADDAAAAAGVRDAIVLVRESWGSQLVARIAALGVARPQAEILYHHVDLCALEETVSDAEAAGLRGDAAHARLSPLLADSARTVPAPFGGGGAGRVLPDSWYSARCLRRAREEYEGFTPLAPLLLSRSGNLYVRDLHERDSLILARHPERSVYLLRPDGDTDGFPPRFHRLDRDSLMAAWRTPAPADSGARIRITNPASQPRLPHAAGSSGPGSRVGR